MKIGNYNFLFKYQDKIYDTMEEMVQDMTYEQLREKSSELEKVLQVLTIKRKSKKREMHNSKAIMIFGGIALLITPFMPTPILKCVVCAAGALSLGGGFACYKNEKYKHQLFTLKMLTTKFQQREINNEIKNRLNGITPIPNLVFKKENNNQDNDGNEDAIALGEFV